MLIRMMAVDALTDAGFAVMEVEHADDALNILTAQAHEVRALFTDINTRISTNLPGHICIDGSTRDG